MREETQEARVHRMAEQHNYHVSKSENGTYTMVARDQLDVVSDVSLDDIEDFLWQASGRTHKHIGSLSKPNLEHLLLSQIEALIATLAFAIPSSHPTPPPQKGEPWEAKLKANGERRDAERRALEALFHRVVAIHCEAKAKELEQCN